MNRIKQCFDIKGEYASLLLITAFYVDHKDCF